MRNQNFKAGFGLIGLLITFAIIFALIAMYYGSSGGGSNTKSIKQTGDKAIEQTKLNNASQIEQHLEIQNELNSIE